MTYAQIRFSTDILRRLGEELNPSPDQGILELVKNAYDADARTCRVELVNTNRIGGTIIILDDGIGMDANAIENGWLVLGQSRKSKLNRTKLGRIQAGSKGLGRLAALRMGTSAALITRPAIEKKSQYKILIDWEKYNDASVVEDVQLNIDHEIVDGEIEHGSEITISGLRTRISRADVTKLARALVLLADPFGDNPIGFEPILIAPAFNDLEKLVRKRYFDEADFHLIAGVDATGYASARVVDWRGGELFIAEHDELTSHRKNRPYDCPPVTFDLWVYIMTSESFYPKNVNLGQVREWLKSFGGVHLYENGLRVAPYGNPGNDWLDINLRRAQSPEERPSTNTAIGRVSIADTDNSLIQKTDRSGFIENDSFQEVRAFSQDAMEWLARRRLEIAEARRAKARKDAPVISKHSKSKIESAIENAPKASKETILRAFKDYERSRNREVLQLNKEVQLYRTLSTAGITAATFAHESRGNPIKILSQSINAIQRRTKQELGDKYESLLKKPIEGVISAIDSLSVLSNATLNLLSYSKRRIGRVNIHSVIMNVIDLYQPFFNGRKVNVLVELFEGSPYIRGSEAAIESIITNLLNNSLTAFEQGGTTKRSVKVVTESDGNTVNIRVLDNGQGITGISKKDIWLPGQTTQLNGTGLGLSIVRDTVRDYGGTVDVNENGELGGAEFIIRLPILGT